MRRERSSASYRRWPSAEPTSPTTAGMPRDRRPFRTRSGSVQSGLPGSALDPVPVQVEADDVDAERLEPVEPVLDRAAAVREPGVILDPEADSTEASAAGAAKPNRQTRTAATVRRIVSGYLGVFLPTRKDPVNVRGAAGLAALHCRRATHRCAPDVEHEREERGQALQDAAHGRHASNRKGTGRLTPGCRGETWSVGGEIEELFADLWQAAVRRPPARLPARGRLLRHRRPAPAERRRRAGGDRPGPWSSHLDGQALTSPASGRARAGGQVYQQAEIEYGHFERRIPLGFEVTGSSASASYEAGLLRITLPIAKAPPRRGAVTIVVHRRG